MPKFEVTETFYFRENGQKLDPGQTIELTEEQAAERNAAHPGLLKAVRLTTQAHPAAIRDDAKPKTRLTRSKK